MIGTIASFLAASIAYCDNCIIA